MTRGAVVLALLAVGLPLHAQARPGPRGGCVFSLDHVGGTGIQRVFGADTNYYAGGGVRLSCAGTPVRMTSDSLTFYGRGRNTTVIFTGHVKYRDSTITMDADQGTYFKTGERWEARGNVVTENLDNGSTLRGPSLDYYRVMPGQRDTLELYAIGRPTIWSVPRDSAGGRGEAYIVVADRVRMKGNERMWGGGKVTIDRSDFAARADSLFLDNGPAGEGLLLGSPVMRGQGRDSFELTGRRINLTLERQAITYVMAVGHGHAVSRDLDLVADTIGLDLEAQQLVQTLAWGDSLKPRGLTADYEIRGDSLAFDTPARRLSEVRAFIRGWVGGAVDSVSRERDWMSGDTVVARFVQWDSAGTPRTSLSTLSASGSAHSFYRVSDAGRNAGLPSINYARGDQITVHMKAEGRRGVERVDLRGRVDGLNLEPQPVTPVAPDSLRERLPGGR
jgi:hypothetical protein